MRKHRGRLDASVGASGPHDFAVRLFAPFVKGAKASTASRKPNVRDDRETPLVQGHGTAEFMKLIWAKREAIYFCGEDWTGSIGLIGFGNLAVRRKGVVQERFSLRCHSGEMHCHRTRNLAICVYNL